MRQRSGHAVSLLAVMLPRKSSSRQRNSASLVGQSCRSMCGGDNSQAVVEGGQMQSLLSSLSRGGACCVPARARTTGWGPLAGRGGIPANEGGRLELRS